MPPVEPPPAGAGTCRPTPRPDEHGVVGVGADLEPGTLLLAYRTGLFPMGLGARAAADGLVVARSARRRAARRAARGRSAAPSARRFEVRMDLGLRRRGAAPAPTPLAAGAGSPSIATCAYASTSWAGPSASRCWDDDEARRRPLRRGRRRPVRRRVDVPPPHRRLEGGPRHARRRSSASDRRPTRHRSTSSG